MRFAPVLAIIVVLTLCPLCLCGEPALETRLSPLARDHKGKVAIAVKHLGTGQGWTLNGDDVMPTTVIPIALHFGASASAITPMPRMPTVLSCKSLAGQRRH